MADELINVGAVSGGALNIIVMIVAGLVVGGIVIFIAWLFLRNKKFEEFVAIIWVKDGFGQLTQKIDKGGIFVDNKTNNKRLFLEKSNVGLSTEKIPFIPMVYGGKKYIFLLQTGLKNFHYVHINIDTSDLVTCTVTEEDVNWGINSYERQKKIFGNSLLMQLLPYIAIAFTSIIILTIFIFFFKEFKTLKEFAEIMKQMMSDLIAARGPLEVTQ